MGKLLPRSFERIRSGEQIVIPSFTNVAAAVAAGVTAAKFPRRVIYLSAGGTGSVPCLAVTDGTNRKPIGMGASAIYLMGGLLPVIGGVRRPLWPVAWPAAAKPVPVPVVPAGDGKG